PAQRELSVSSAGRILQWRKFRAQGPWRACRSGRWLAEAQLRGLRVVASLVPKIRRKLPLAGLRMGVAALLLSAAALHAVPAAASITQESLFQDDNQLKANPNGTMQTLRDLGVQRVRVNLSWSTVAPAATS